MSLDAFDAAHDGAVDGFLAKLNPAGAGVNDLWYSTFLGGEGSHSVQTIALDSLINLSAAGDAGSSTSEPRRRPPATRP